MNPVAAPMTVTLVVHREINEDVKAGLELYADLVARYSREDLPSWLNALRDGPFGKPYLAVATDQGRVVGFCAIIPMNSTINGRSIRSGKAEFYVVDPASRKAATVEGPLTIAIMNVLYQTARSGGMEMIFALPSKEAEVIQKLVGAKLMTVQYCTFRIALRLQRMHWRSFLIFLAGSCSLVFMRFLGIFGSRSGASSINAPELLADNTLVRESDDTLRMRFLDGSHSYFVSEESSLIISHMRHGSHLSFYRGHAITLLNLAMFISDAAVQARRLKSQSLTLVIDQKAMWLTTKLKWFGLFCTRSPKRIYVYGIASEALSDYAKAIKWNNLHQAVV